MGVEVVAKIAEEEIEAQKNFEHEIRVCVAAGCLSSQSDKVLQGIQNAINDRGIGGKCKAKGVGCLGLCKAGPLVAVEPDKILYQNVKAEDAQEIVDSVGDKTVERLQLPADMPFFSRQRKIVLENSGVIDAERIEEYIAREGYMALAIALTEKNPLEIIDNVVKSGLRGRGGGGFPTGLKWGTVSKAIGRQKYVVCNADEGDPGAFMDRSVLESDPHRVLEGMAIAGIAVGANRGYIYVRAEYPLAVKRLQAAIRQAEKLGFLGENILGTPFGFKIEIRLGAGAFVCGEETALLASIEGGRGTPRPRPPYPASKGLWGCPTLINNVETFANVPPIIRKGAEFFSAIGTTKSKGTKVFALAGAITNTGLIEVPMGMTLREIIFDIGGGILGGKKFKAVQTGGPSGGCIPEQHLDVAVDYDSLMQLGSIMGSGGMIVMDDSSCMVDVARFFMEFCKSESCGKCVPCRVGTAQMYNLLSKFMDKQATEADLALLERLSDMVKSTSLCGLGQTSPNPVLSTLRFFRHEYTSLLQTAHK